MIDYKLMKLMHRHEDEWATLELVDEHAPEPHPTPTAHDPERSPRAWTGIYRCTTCAEEFALGTGDPASPDPGRLAR